MNDFEKFYLTKYRLVDTATKHCFDVTLSDFEQIIDNGFIQLEAN